MQADRDEASRGGEEDLVETVQALQRQVDGLLEGGKLRSVIEQAKGVLAERLGITTDEAFVRLRSISQANNARLVDVAATVIGEASTSHDPVGFDESHFPRKAGSGGETSASWRATREDPLTRAGASDAVAGSLAAAASSGDEAARLLVQVIGGGVHGCLLMALRNDDSLELVGSWGYPAEATSAWRRIPMGIDVPMTVSARDGTPLFFEKPGDLHRAFPGLDRVKPTFNCFAVLPVTDNGAVIGVVALAWQPGHIILPAVRERLMRQVSRVGPALLDDLRPLDHETSELTAVLRVSSDPWLILAARTSSCDDVAGLVIEQVSEQVEDRDHLVGRLLFGAIPRLAQDEALVMQLERLLRKDGLLVLDRADLRDVGAPWDGAAGFLRAARSHGRLVLMWAEHP